MRYWLILLVIFITGCNRPLTNSQVPTPIKDKETTVSMSSFDSTFFNDHEKIEWKLTFQDEFDQPEVSNILWNKLNYGYRDHGRLHFYLPEQVSSTDGILRLQVEKEDFEDYPYRSGAVTTQGNHEQLYGKFEVRAKFPSGQGLLPAIWLLPSNGDPYPEIDIVEMLGQVPNELWHVIHIGDGKREYKLTKGLDGSDWHVYTLIWLENTIIFYIDGTEQFRTDNSVKTSMYLLMNVAVGGTWVGDPNEKTVFPASMDIDYVRIYSQR
ncbi:MAG: glycoside hydrolase family 16 protein [Paenisporosarcina sp.]|nr:glycoside hydrolase family 16 protein [Paenisporosarcina sp.]